MRPNSESGEPTAPRDFFISFNQTDRAWAEWIAWQLKGAGYTTSLQSRNLAPGAHTFHRKQAGTSGETRTIAVLSPEYVSSRFAHPEWAQAFARDPLGERGTLLTVRVRDVELRGLLSTVAYIDLVGLDEEDARTALLAGVRGERAKLRPAPGLPSNARSAPEEPSFPGAVSPVWNVPERNPHFTGREDVLAELREALQSGGAGSVLVIGSIGGMGKTQLAVEYAYRNSADYDLVWWINAEQPTALVADLAGLAGALNLWGSDEPDSLASVEAVQAWLASHERWLLIFDGVEDPHRVRPYLPRARTGHVILTSRNAVPFESARSLIIDRLARDEAVAFLQRRTGTTDEAGAAALAEELGDLPLALEMAAAYMITTPQPISAYLDLFRRRRSELRSGEDRPVVPVAVTWGVAVEELEKRSLGGADLMRLLAFLAPDEISLSLPSLGVDLLPPPLADVVADEARYSEAVSVLRRYSLVHGTADAVSVHFLVQSMVRDRLAEDEKRTWAATAVRIIARAFADDTREGSTEADTAHLLPHAISSVTHAEPLGAAPEVCAHLLNHVGKYLHARGELSMARSTLERALRIGESRLGEEHPEVVATLNNLGFLLQNTGHLDAARTSFERALRISEATLGLEHPDAVAAVNNVARVLEQSGQYFAASEHFEHALRISETMFGPDHPQTAILLRNLARVLQALDRPGEARLYLERALQVTQTFLDPEHPVIASLLNNLGLVLVDLGELTAAREHLKHALRITEAVHGPGPHVAKGLSNFATLLRKLGDANSARTYLERALRMDEAFYGPGHLAVSTDLVNLALVLHDLGDPIAARALLDRALQITRTLLGPEHPQTAVYAALRDKLENQTSQEGRP